MYVIRDEYDCAFVSVISNSGIQTSKDFKKAIFIDEIGQAKHLLDYLSEEDYVIEEIALKRLESEE